MFKSNFWGFKNRFKQKQKKHNFTKYEWGKDYVFEPSEENKKGYITGYKKGIKPGDLILIKDTKKVSFCYQIEEIDYYFNPPDMWTAFVSLCPEEEEFNK